MRLWSGRLVKTHRNQALAGGRTMVFDTRHQTRPGIRCPAPHIRQDRGAAAFSLITAAVLLLFSAHAHADCPAAPLTSPDDLVISFRTGEGGPQASPGALLASTQKDGMLVYDGATKSLKLCNGTSWITLQGTAAAGAAAGSVAGAVQFRGAGGNLAADDANFVWDDTNNRLGIGTATPLQPLDILSGTTNSGLRIQNAAGAVNFILTPNNASSWSLIDNTRGQLLIRNSESGALGYIGLRAGGSSTDQMRLLPNGSLGIGTTTPEASALVDITSTSRGLLPPRMTGVQRDAIASPANGLVVYNSTTNTLDLRANGAWVSLLAGAGSEADPQVGTLTANKWCAANAGGTAIDCTADAPATGAAGTASEVQFRNSGTGAFAADTALMWDNTSKSLGIGTSTPDGQLHLHKTVAFDTPAGGVVFTRYDAGAADLRGAGIFNYFDSNAGREILAFGLSQSTTPNTLANTKMVIRHDGNVGIGTSTPSERLMVAGNIGTTRASTDYNVLTMTNTGGVQVHLNANGNAEGNLRTVTNHPLSFSTNNTERMRIDTAGNVGIGTSTPAAVIHATGQANAPPATSGSAQTGAAIRAGSGNSSNVLDVGINNTGSTYAWVQSTLSTNLTTNYPLVLNPNGGNVGIGTTAPGSELEVRDTAGDNDVRLNLRPTSSVLSQVGASASFLFLDSGGSRPISFWTNSLERMRIDGSGNVGIGTTTPTSRLHVEADGSTQAITARGGAFDAAWLIADNRVIGLHKNTNSGNIMEAYTSVSGWQLRMALSANGNIWINGTLTQSSDERLKTHIKTIPNALSKIASLRGVTFNWKDTAADPSNQLGVIAQDVEKEFPEAVSATENGYKSVSYSALVAPLIEAVKELKAANDNFSTENASLRQRLEDVERRLDQLAPP